MNAYTVSRLALDAGVSVHIVRDYLLRGLLPSRRASASAHWRGCAGRWMRRTAMKLPRSLLCCVSSSNAGAKRWPIWKCSWPPCRPRRHSMRRVCHEQPRAHAGRDAQTVHRLPVGHAGRADLPLPPVHPRCRAGRHNRRCIPCRVLGHHGARFDRPVSSVTGAGVAGIQGKIMSASRPDGWTTAEGPSVRARARLSVRKADAGGGIRRLRQSMEGCHHECK